MNIPGKPRFKWYGIYWRHIERGRETRGRWRRFWVKIPTDNLESKWTGMVTQQHRAFYFTYKGRIYCSADELSGPIINLQWILEMLKQ